jgi:hypothetical protein
MWLSLDANAQVRALEAPQPGDNYQGLAYRAEPLINLAQLGGMHYLFGEANFRPWNGSYWPTQKGMLAHRYNDAGFPGSKNWATNYSYYMSNPGDLLVAQGRIDNLSPAEKYDLLNGDTQWTLTRSMWNKGVGPAQKWGNVPGWFGICHGWSAAAHMRVPEPQHPVAAISVNGTPITFYPNDIKALASYLWANSAPASLFIGKKCRDHNPERDEWGRVIDAACIDTNPATWHTALLNRMGRDGDSLVMDSSMNNEIWNYAIDSYSFRYFNLNTMKPSRGWEEAVLPKAEVYEDPYLAHRDPAAAFLVGVTMEVFFPAAIEPKAFGRISKPLFKSKTFVYDLELDEKMNIVGGEWRTKDRPDFLWTFPFNAQAGGVLPGVSPWGVFQPVPADLAEKARELSGRSKVAAPIVTALVEKSVLSAGQQHGDGEEERPVDEPGGTEDPGPEPGPQTPGAT